MQAKPTSNAQPLAGRFHFQPTKMRIALTCLLVALAGPTLPIRIVEDNGGQVTIMVGRWSQSTYSADSREIVIQYTVDSVQTDTILYADFEPAEPN